jgi:DNA-binding beta-propeller fold protein YncE
MLVRSPVQERGFLREFSLDRKRKKRIANEGNASRFRSNWLVLAVIVIASVVSAQTSPATQKSRPLVLTGAIPLAGVQGRIDHFGVDTKGHLFVSALGNNTEEVLDLTAGRAIRSLSVPRPQGVVYAPASNELFVGSDEGKLYIYNGDSLELITSLDFGDDVDNLRYDAAKGLVYVGYGDEEAGAIAVVDAATNKRLDADYKLGAHPESFRLEVSGPNIYVNLPDLKQIAVINRSTNKITRWPMTLESNFPMALNEVDHRLFVITHAPARLVVFDTDTGHQLAALPCVQNSDDVFYDSARKRIYVPGGEGSIDVFQQQDANHYGHIASVPSAVGARTGGYFGKGKKGFEVLYVAVPARADHGAEVLIYTVQD